jgi:transglutaminase-like putative cysteine protease
MTQRPRLSERVVMRVHADRASFWRTSTFDLWSGRSWGRSEGMLALVGGTIAHEPFDLAATEGEELTQRIRLESRYAELMPAAPSPVSIQASASVGQWPDGSLVPAFGAVGSGTSYTVVSRQIPVTEAQLESADPAVPPEVLARYARRPVATDRVIALAAEITAGAATPYDRVRAIEAWMGSHTEYSQQAPLAPTDADVVDDFLFESKRGWCEQIASSLTVLLRLSGVPARLATGFVPGDWDPITRAFEVRESDAHAWTEVWFAGLGWVPFDPTADVPLSGEAAATGDLAGFWWANADVFLVAVAAIAALIGPVRTGLESLWRRVRRRGRRVGVPGRRSVGWVADAERRIEAVGKRRGRVRDPAETLTAYAASVTPDRELAAVGARVDAAVYAQREPDEEDRAAVEAALHALESEVSRSD